MQLKRKNRFVQCMEKVLWLIKHVRSGLRSFHAGVLSPDDATQSGRPVEVNSNLGISWEESTLYHTGDSQHTQNIQINKVIGESEKYVFYFTEKTLQTFWSAQHFRMLPFPLYFSKHEGFFSDICCKDLVDLQEVKLTKMWGTSRTGSPYSFYLITTSSFPTVALFPTDVYALQ